MGYDPASYCDHCGANSYEAYGTEFCEDYKAEKQKRLEQKERRHGPTEAAWNRARELLTREEWSLMELDRYPHSRPYRVVDRIEIR
jgi:hypothetical protein